MNYEDSLKYAAQALGNLASDQRAALAKAQEEAQKAKDKPPENKPMTLADLTDKIVKVAAAATALGALTYLLGFVIVNSHYSRFGVRVFDVSVPTYLIAGSGFFINFVLPCLASVFVLRARIVRSVGKLIQALSNLHAMGIGSLTRVFAAALFLLLLNILFFMVLVGLIPVALLEFLGTPNTGFSDIFSFPTLSRILETSEGVMLMSLYLGLVLILGFQSGLLKSTSTHAAAFFQMIAEQKKITDDRVQKMLAMIEKQNRTSEGIPAMKALGAILVIVPVMVISTFLWSSAVYPNIGHAFGGGHGGGSRVALVFKRSDPDAAHLMAVLRDQHGVEFLGGMSEPLVVLEENSDAAIVLIWPSADGSRSACSPRRPRQDEAVPAAVRIPKSLITSAVFSRCPSQGDASDEEASGQDSATNSTARHFVVQRLFAAGPTADSPASSPSVIQARQSGH